MGFKGWGSANDVIRKELARDGRLVRGERNKGTRSSVAGFEKNTNKHSMKRGNCKSILLS